MSQIKCRLFFFFFFFCVRIGIEEMKILESITKQALREKYLLSLQLRIITGLRDWYIVKIYVLSLAA